jgi:hypothetical protein
MRRHALALLLGILIGIACAFIATDAAGGWYEYEIRPTARCQPDSGATINMGSAQPVPHQSHPCLFRRPRFTLWHY